MSNSPDSSAPAASSLRRALGFLRLLAAGDQEGMRLKDLAEAAGAALPTVHRAMQDLVAEGFVEQVSGGKRYRLALDFFVLAAGAFMTPALLLRSSNEFWPRGLANNTDLVGRNLMFHAGDFFAVSPLENLSGQGPQKTLALNDFYHAEGVKLGTFQSLGAGLNVGQIMQYLRDTADSNPKWWSRLFASRPIWWRKLSSPVVRSFAMVFYHLLRFRDAGVWVSIIEDLPYLHNRVIPDPAHPRDIRIRYRYSEELKGRVILFRRKLRRALGRHRVIPLTQADKIDYPHVSGTCRFGDDSATSVLDRNNRAHGIDNLYVVDASFFPSSGGTNPSLTVAANALRVADVILGRTHSPSESNIS